MDHLLLEPVATDGVGMYSGKDVQIMKSVKVIEIHEIHGVVVMFRGLNAITFLVTWRQLTF